MDLILHTHEHLPLHGFYYDLKCSKFQDVKTKRQQTLLTIMSALYQPPLYSDFGVRTLQRYA